MSIWGKSWGKAWGSAFGALATVVPGPTPEPYQPLAIYGGHTHAEVRLKKRRRSKRDELLFLTHR
jgi:hypothetical protein